MSLMLAFPDSRPQADQLAAALGLPCHTLDLHHFPDGESRLRLPVELPAQVILFRSLHDPNSKLVELLLAARTARELGAQRLLLVSPYLCYMRQDMAFTAGEAVSQKIIGGLLAQLFDGVITVDAHLHRIHSLAEAVPLATAINLQAAELLGDYVASHYGPVLLLGPDEESRQWVSQVAARAGVRFGIASKQRHGDRQVTIALPALDFAGQQVVLVDDMISSGHTLAQTARQLYATGASRVDALCTHALYDAGAAALLKDAGIRAIGSCDSVSHPSNVIALASLLARACSPLLSD